MNMKAGCRSRFRWYALQRARRFRLRSRRRPRRSSLEESYTQVARTTQSHSTVRIVAWVSHGLEPFNTQRGVAYADDKIVRGTPDDHVIALNAKNGRLLWAEQIANSTDGHFISMPPLIHDGFIYIGPAGSEWAASTCASRTRPG
jgi:outer membrane protein assembly factor BamB